MHKLYFTYIIIIQSFNCCIFLFQFFNFSYQITKLQFAASTSNSGDAALLRYNEKLYKFNVGQKTNETSIKLKNNYQEQIICVCGDIYYEFVDNSNQYAIDIKEMKEINKKVNMGSIKAKQCVYCQFGNFLIIVDDIYLYALDLVNTELLKLTKLRASYKNPKSVYISSSSEICIAYERFYTVFDTLEHTWSETSTNEQQKAQMFLASKTSYLQFPDTQKPKYIQMRQRNNGEPTAVYINKTSNFKNCRAFFQNNMMYTVDQTGNIRVLTSKQITKVCQNQDKFGHFRCDMQEEEEIEGNDNDFEEKVVVVNNKKVIKVIKKIQPQSPGKKSKPRQIKQVKEPPKSQRPKQLVINDFSAQKAEKVAVQAQTQSEEESQEAIIDTKLADMKLQQALEASKKYTNQTIKTPTAKFINPTQEPNINDYESELTNMRPVAVETLITKNNKQIYLHLNEFLPYENDKLLVDNELDFVFYHEIEQPEEVINQQLHKLNKFPIIFPADTSLNFDDNEEFAPIENYQMVIEEQNQIPQMQQEFKQEFNIKSNIEYEQQMELNKDLSKQLQDTVTTKYILPADQSLEFAQEEDFLPMDNILLEIQNKNILQQEDGAEKQTLSQLMNIEQELSTATKDLEVVLVQRKVIVMPEIKRVGGYVPTYENEFQPFDKRILNYKTESPEVDMPPQDLHTYELKEQQIASAKKPEIILADLTLSKQKVGVQKTKYSKPMLRTRGGISTVNQKIGGGQ